MKAGKVWGQTELLEANGVLEFHRIEAAAGGVCSKHKHKFKWNGFFVESGEMIIRVWKGDYDLVDETYLKQANIQRLLRVNIISLKQSQIVLPLNCIGQNLIMMILKEKLLDLINE